MKITREKNRKKNEIDVLAFDTRTHTQIFKNKQTVVVFCVPQHKSILSKNKIKQRMENR